MLSPKTKTLHPKKPPGPLALHDSNFAMIYVLILALDIQLFNDLYQDSNYKPDRDPTYCHCYLT